jgi:hypothetical protein
MKKSALLIALLLGAGSLSAQVTVEASLDQEQFLSGEALPVTVRITNRSGQRLDLGAEQGWLRFSMDSSEGSVISKSGDVPLVEKFSIESGQRAVVRRVDVSPYFRFHKPGRYSVTATVHIPAWNRDVVSEPASFDIIAGSKLWEQEVGLPNPAGVSNRAPEMRKYILHQANYLRKHLVLYVQITDSRGNIHRVFPIGPMLSFGQPEPQVDRWSNLHVLYQNGPRAFSYSLIDPFGNVLARQTYDYTTRPRLKADEDGHIKVVGGTRRVTSTDLPPPDPATSQADDGR